MADRSHCKNDYDLVGIVPEIVEHLLLLVCFELACIGSNFDSRSCQQPLECLDLRDPDGKDDYLRGTRVLQDARSDL